MKRIAVLLIVLLGLVAVSCDNIVLSDNIAPDGSAIPAAPRLTDSKGMPHGNDWLGTARKTYLAVFFDLVEN